MPLLLPWMPNGAKASFLKRPIFYRTRGFDILKPREKGTIPMYLDIWLKENMLNRTMPIQKIFEVTP